MVRNRKAKLQKHQGAIARKAQKNRKRSNHMTKKITKMPALITKPETFSSLESVITYASDYTYSLTRLRPMGGRKTRVIPLGTGFLAGPGRLLTCSHCINNPKQTEDALAQHKDGDGYLLVQKKQYGASHQSVVTPVKGKTLFTFPEIDTAVIYLPDDFYKMGEKFIKNPKNHLLLGKEVAGLGDDVGVLGYPMQAVQIQEDGNVNLGSVILRADKGVINAYYTESEGQIHKYEFTITFNPGNSGGPIFKVSTGEVIGLVHGFNSFEIKLGNGQSTWNSYSVAYSSKNLLQHEKNHELKFVTS